ncbi:type II toxin-antitoxin system HicA family toxin [Halorubellus sp. PRR65]|uniref:type II toxin-antitoxin system HicA family toxin n=1 Tax=Halorubellus sp. PRR65 TaxID=3098148 RepID=UPI002B25708B|nr:type II toxin-antitoxin system HicA family toxin [Halorubellus sp. PRR65]
MKVLRKHRFRPINRTGSHVQLRFEDPETGEVRNVTVPMHESISTGTLRSIASQAGADDFDAFCEWIDRHR